MRMTRDLKLILRYLRTKGFNLRDIVLLGDRADASSNSQEVINNEGTSGYRIVDMRNQNEEALSEFDANEIDEAFVVMGNNVPDFDALVLKLVNAGKAGSLCAWIL